MHRRRIELVGPSGSGKSHLLHLVAESWGPSVSLLRGASPLGRSRLPLRPLRRSFRGLDLDGDAFAIAERLVALVGDGLLVIDDHDALDRSSAAVIEALPTEVRVLAARQQLPPVPRPKATDAWLRIELAPLDPEAADRLARRFVGVAPARTGAAQGNPLGLVVGVDDGETITEAALRTMTRLGPGAAGAVVTVALSEVPLDPATLDADIAGLVARGALVHRPEGLDLANRVWLAAAVAALPGDALDRVAAEALEPSDPLVRAEAWSLLGRPVRAAAEAAEAEAGRTDHHGAADLFLAEASGPGWEFHAAAAVATLSALGRHDEVLAALPLFPAVTDRLPGADPASRGRHPAPVDAATCAHLALAAYALQEPTVVRAAIAAGRSAPHDGDHAAREDLVALELKTMIWSEGRAPEALEEADAAQRRLAAVGARSDLLATARADALAVLGRADAEEAYRSVLRDAARSTSVASGNALSGLSTFLLMNGRLGEGRQLLRRAIRQAEAEGAVGYAMQFRRFLLIARLLEQGPTDATTSEIDLALSRPTTPSHRSLFLALGSLAATWRGDGPAAARTFLSRPALKGDSTATATWGWAAAEWHWHEGRLQDVEAAAVHALSDGGAWFPASTIAQVLARWARLEAGLAVAGEPLRSPFAMVAAATPESLGISALADGEPDTAYDHFMAAAAAWTPGCATGAVRSLDGAAVAADRAGRAQDANKARRRAGAIAARLELHPRRPLLRLGGGSQGRPRDRAHEAELPPGAPQRGRAGRQSEDLTASEGAVMELVASGLTSEQVATHRGVKASTIESQVSSARAKLGGGNRRTAAAIASADRRRAVEVWLITDERTDPAATARRLYGGMPIVDLIDLANGARIQPGSVQTGTLRTLIDADRVHWALEGDIDVVIRISSSDHPGLAALGEELRSLAWVRRVARSPTIVEQIPVRHRRLLALLAAGRSIPEAGRSLGTSERSTHRDLVRIRSALGVSSTAAAVALFRSSALAPKPPQTR
ncbi:hypothetical protein BH10ACT1_BH10ACT1_13460 [soil metagenome]